MKSSRPIKFSVLVLIVLGVVLTTHASPLERLGMGESAVMHTVTYPLYDLPVYRLGKDPEDNFDPSILIALIRRSIAPESWQEAAADITIYPQNLSMAVCQTDANHARLADLLKSIRRKRPK